jgi:hypothetical protein
MRSYVVLFAIFVVEKCLVLLCLSTLRLSNSNLLLCFCAFLIFEFAFARDAYDVDGDNMVKSSYFIYALRKVDIKTFLTNKK